MASHSATTLVSEVKSAQLGSLAKLESEHLILLNALDDSEPSESPAIEDRKQQILDFLKSSVAAGSEIDKPDDRRQAQGLIDYWVANLYSLDPRGARRLDLREMVLAPFDHKVVEKVVVNAQSMADDLHEDQKLLLREILLRTVRMNTETREFVDQPVSYEELEALGPPNQIKSLTRKLVDAGVVREEPVPPTNTPGIGLSHQALPRTWPFFGDALDRRLKLAEAADFWFRTNRDPGLLITTQDLLDEVQRYHDLTDREKLFVDKSLQRKIGQDRTKMRLLWGGVVVLAGFAFGGAILAYSRSAALTAANKLNDQLATTNAKLEETATKLSNEQVALKKSLEETQEAREASERNAALVTQKLQETQVLKANTDRTLTTLRNLLEELLTEKKDLSVPEPLRRKAIDVRKKYKDAFATLDRAQVGKTGTKIQPGTTVQSADGKIQSTAGVFLQGPNGEPYLLAPSFVTDRKNGTLVFDATLPDGKTKKYSAKFGSQGAIGRSLTDFDVARVDAGAPVSNKLADGREITGWVENPKVSMKVRGYGAVSGPSRDVPIKDIRKDGVIVTPRISLPGDAGGPVVDSDGKLVGLIMGSNGTDETYIKPVNQFFDKRNYKILKSN